MPEPIRGDRDTDLIPEAWLIEGDFDLEEFDLPERVSVDRNEQEAIEFEILVEDRIRRLGGIHQAVCLSPPRDRDGLLVPIYLNYLDLVPVAAALRAPGDVAAEALWRCLTNPLPFHRTNCSYLSHGWADRVRSKGLDLQLLRACVIYDCEECEEPLSEMIEIFDNAEHCITCRNDHLIFYRSKI